MPIVHVFLSRRNLQMLLAKLDNPASKRTIIKNDFQHPVYPITGAEQVMITAVEDSNYYTDREPGRMLEDAE